MRRNSAAGAVPAAVVCAAPSACADASAALGGDGGRGTAVCPHLPAGAGLFCWDAPAGGPVGP